MTPATTCPLLWDGDGFRSIRDVLPDLAEWGERCGTQDHPNGRGVTS